MSAANHHAFYLTRNKASETGAAEPDQQLSKLTSLIGKVHIASRALSFPQRCSREHYYFFLDMSPRYDATVAGRMNLFKTDWHLKM